MFVGYVLRPEHVPSLLFVDSQFETEEKNKSKKKGGERSWGKDLIISIKAQMMVTERIMLVMVLVMLKMLQTKQKKKNKDSGHLWGDDVCTRGDDALEGTMF